jgi:hypothetical protein
MLQDNIHRLVQGAPTITHLIAAEPVGVGAAKPTCVCEPGATLDEVSGEPPPDIT